MIRHALSADIDKVDILLKRRSKALITWLFSNQENPENLSLFVLLDGNESLEGIVGYTLDKYRYNDKIFSGVIPMSWFIDPAFRGVNGLRLLLKSIVMGDFGFAIGGSKIAQASYKMAKLEKRFVAGTYYKILKPVSYMISGKDKFVNALQKTLYYLPSFLPGQRAEGEIPDLSVTEFNGEEFVDNPMAVNVFHHIETPVRVNWLLSCPQVEASAFTVWYKGQPIGAIIMYIAAFKGVKRGRIVHIPYLGKDLYNWLFALSFCRSYLYKNGCSMISVFANNSEFRHALKKSKFIRSRSQDKNVYLRDLHQKLNHIPLENWHLTYYESDKAYRNI